MRNLIDFTSWQTALSTLLGMVMVTLLAVGIRLGVMHRIQRRRESQNRQINERLKTLIAAYKILGGSFTGDLAVDPRHLRELRKQADVPQDRPADEDSPPGGSERRRRIRDAVEAALSDVMLLGTASQVRLAAQAANDMVAGQKIETAALVESLRGFIREVLDLEAVPADLAIPKQGPVRGASSGGRGGAASAGGRGGAKGKEGGSANGSDMAGLGLGMGQPAAAIDSVNTGHPLGVVAD